MGVSFQCGHCGKSFEVGYEVAGKTGRCKRCGSIYGPNRPLFLFQARDDANTPAAAAEAFGRQATSAGKSVTFDLVDTGGHYDSMIRQGIPHAIAWLKGEPIPPSDAGLANRMGAQPPFQRGPQAQLGGPPQIHARERLEALQKRRDEIRPRIGRGPRP